LTCRSYQLLISDVENIKISYKDQKIHTEDAVDETFAKIKLEDASVLATLGVGGFGRVELVSAYPVPFSRLHTA
jgi:UTP:GlnB (protein PII) uridylyltransferase